MSGLQPTASKTALLLECSRPFDPETEIEERETGAAAEYGTAFHAIMHQAFVTGAAMPAGTEYERLLVIPDRYNTSVEVARGLAAHVREAETCLRTWMAGANPWGLKLKVESAEKPRAVRLSRDGVESRRSCKFEASTHVYDLRPGEIGGTPDLVLIAKRDPQVKVHLPWRVVVDYKTGTSEDFSNPETPQMRTLALLTAADAVAILHTPREGIPVVYARDLEHQDCLQHEEKLRQALSRIGDGSMRPGPWCKRCPARPGCPTDNAEVAKATTALVKQIGNGLKDLRELDIGKIHQMLPAADRGLDLMRAEIKELVRSGEIIERPDGKTLQIVNRTVERMASKGDFQKAMAADEFEKLRAAGLVKTTTEERLEAK
jgi:hypothetical protein